MPEDLIFPATRIARGLRDEIAAVLADRHRGERLREGLVVAITGPPNAGKSTLFNRLARREAAIVSPYAGTTRDIIEVHLELDGYPVTILDTAGIRDSGEPVEQEGMRRARERASAADLVLWVTDASTDERTSSGVPSRAEGAPLWLIKNKIDLVPSHSAPSHEVESHTKAAVDKEPKNSEREFIFSISATRGVGLDAVASALSRFAADTFGGGEASLVTRARHRRSLEETVAAIDCALAEAAAKDSREELMAEELRRAAASLGRLIGRVDVEDVLDAIFRDFCIGK